MCGNHISAAGHLNNTGSHFCKSKEGDQIWV